MLLDKYVRELSKLDDLVVSVDINNKIIIRFDKLVVKDGCAIKGVVGRGDTFYQALEDYINQINGQLIINEKNSDNNIQYKILIIEKE